MSDAFDDSNILIGDEEIVSNRSPGIDRLSSLFKSILNPPKLPANLNLTPQEQWEQFCSGEGKQWFAAWQALSVQNLRQYINMISTLPEPLAATSWLPSEHRRSIPYQRLRVTYRGTAVWMLCLTESNLTPKPIWNDYEPFGLRSKALLNLCNSVYYYQGSDNILHTERNLFSSDAHLWFWCIVADCMTGLRGNGLLAPLSSEQLKNKTTMLREWQEDTENIKYRKAGSFTKIQDWEDFLEHLDLHVIAEAMKGNYIQDHEQDTLDALIKTEEKIRNIFRRSKVYQGSFLYQFCGDTAIRTYITEQNVKLPKPPRHLKKKL